MLEQLFRFFTSLRLTVVLLAFGLLLVFFGTLAQESLGLYEAQARYFRSFFVDASSLYAALHKGADMIAQGFGRPLAPLDAHALLTSRRVPAFPGGYLIGGLLLINLLAAHTRYYRAEKRKIGVIMIHLGVVLLLIGQLLTDLLSVESSMHIRQGASKNYSEAGRSFEIAITDTSDTDSEKVVSIPTARVQKSGEVKHSELPFTVRAKKFYANSSMSREAAAGFERVQNTSGYGNDLWWRQMPLETEMNRRDMPSAILEFSTPQGSLGTFLVSAFLTQPQRLTHAGRNYEVVLRPQRFYKPFSLHLVEFKFDRYPGTEIPKNFSSRVRVHRPDTGEDREVLIFMNNPLRYGGETFYQADWDKEDEKGTILQVVRNPSWLTPYLACTLVALGLVYQFVSHLIGFATKRKTA